MIDAYNSVLTSSNIASVIQEIVGRPGWSSGNAIGLHWDENMSDQDLSQGWVTWNSSSYIEPQLSITYTVPQCQDGSDNDNDGLSDYPGDPGCSSASDTAETGSAVCDNGSDEVNDRDTLADYRLSGGDPGCSSASDTSEIDGVCDDSVDDASDADSLADASDPGCTSTSDTSEITAVCDDKIDNDSDTYTDYPSDGGCTGYSDNDESGGFQCGDGSDNDSDGATDYSGGDFSCSSATDNDETNPRAQCQDGVDNGDPEDSLVDYPADPGCSNAQDNDETNSVPGSSGYLISSIFDTGFANGVKINSISWQGALNGVTNYVRFQIASSNCSNGATNAPTCSSNVGWGSPKTGGDGALVGLDGTSSTYYSPSGPGVNYVIPTDEHNNKRYFRYKVELYKDPSSSSPTVNDVVINWSP